MNKSIYDFFDVATANSPDEHLPRERRMSKAAAGDGSPKRPRDHCHQGFELFWELIRGLKKE
jgi:hypothetical protein